MHTGYDTKVGVSIKVKSFIFNKTLSIQNLDYRDFCAVPLSDHLYLSSLQNTSLWFYNHIFLFLKLIFSAPCFVRKTVKLQEKLS